MLVRELSETAGIEIEERNYARKPLTEDEVRELVQAAGGVSAVLSTRNKEVKAAGWASAAPEQEAFVVAAAEVNNMIRRPVLIMDDRVVVGHSPDATREAITGAG